VRKAQQKKILDMLKSLEEIHDRLRRCPTQEASADLLAECQSVAIQSGEYIESIAGEGTGTVALLEEYCDLVFKAYEDESGTNYSKKLQTQAIKITNSVRSELKPNRIEVVFFPYQLSMFDALQSVYQAAKEDPNCDAYVIPIPWYERLPDGELGKMHYDGDKYPKNIPVTDWREYDVEARHPDVIFIHAPFDKRGHVTSLHPDYYSKRLRELTDLLCYIPYFVYFGDVDENHMRYEGCAYAHKVFLQSEEVRDTHIRIFRENFGDQFGKAKDKFVALGSPKFDAVINAKREDYELPEQWSKLISGKKVILYNTSIGAALENDEKNTNKIRSVLNTFRERDDVVLWWRPHPLLEANYRSMRPHLLSKYQQIVEDYKCNNWGIYDDTPDLHRAIAWTDMYYGDRSSLVAMYQCLEKPIMIQVGTDFQDIDLVIGSLLYSSDCLWVTPVNTNALFKLDKDTWQAEYIGSFPSEQLNAWRLFSSIIQYGNSLYFCPFYADSMAIFNIDSGEFRSLPIPTPGDRRGSSVEYAKKKKFVRALEIDGVIYLIPGTYPAIIAYDIATGHMEMLDDWVDECSGCVIDKEQNYFLESAFDETRNTLVLPCVCANAVVELDLASRTTKVLDLGDSGTGYLDVLILDGIYWFLLLHKASLVSYDPKSLEKMEYAIPVEATGCDEYNLYQRLMEANGCIFLSPAIAGNVLKFNLADESFSRVEGLNMEVFSAQEKAGLRMYNFQYINCMGSDRFYFHNRKTNKFTEFNPSSGHLREEAIKATDAKNYDRLREYIFLNNTQIRKNESLESANECVMTENTFFQLENMLDIMVQTELPEWLQKLLQMQTQLRRNDVQNSNGQAGFAIYEYCKKEVFDN